MSRWFTAYGLADVFDHLLVGAYPLDEDDVQVLVERGVRRVFNLAEDLEYRPGDRQAVQRALLAAGIQEERLRLPDYGGLPPEALDVAVREVSGWLDRGETTYLHCRAGWQRSAAVAAAVIAHRVGADIDEALAYVQARKPTADPLPHQREDLRRWWEAQGRRAADGRG